MIWRHSEDKPRSLAERHREEPPMIRAPTLPGRPPTLSRRTGEGITSFDQVGDTQTRVGTPPAHTLDRSEVSHV
jgi:hypothetical protein